VSWAEGLATVGKPFPRQLLPYEKGAAEMRERHVSQKREANAMNEGIVINDWFDNKKEE
jgi:hypothetical protein